MVPFAAGERHNCLPFARCRSFCSRSHSLTECQRTSAAAKNPQVTRTENVGRMNALAEGAAKRLRPLLNKPEGSGDWHFGLLNAYSMRFASSLFMAGICY